MLPFKAGFHSFTLPQSLLQLTIYKVNEIGNLGNKIKWLAKKIIWLKGDIIQGSVAENKIEFGWKIRKILQNI